ncbi:CoA transferase [Rhodobacteraceae bacterium NNCM2]|nr:CoA transferase [Coraliihabitans acroporae]
MAGPLDGIRIIDLTAMISGPLGAMILADQGADVIKVENPNGGDHARGVATRRGGFSASFLNNNRNKRSIALDLRSEAGKAACLRLFETADVVMQNFRPGVVDRLGIGYEAAKAVNPDIIYASITGFGHQGPYSSKPVFDPLIQSLSGLTTVQAVSDRERPRLIRTILPDKLTGFTVAQAISSALVAKLRGAGGQHIRLSMLDTVVHFLWSSDMGGYTFVGDEIDPVGAQSWIDLIYETADGYISVAAFRRVDWEKIADACERPEWKEDPRFLTTEGLEKHKAERLELTQEALRERSSAEWIERLEAHDVPCAPVLTRSEMIKHPQIVANGLVVEHDHPDAGRIRQSRPPAEFEGTPNTYRKGAPQLGGDTRSILSDAGYSDAEIEKLIGDGIAVEAKKAS